MINPNYNCDHIYLSLSNFPYNFVLFKICSTHLEPYYLSGAQINWFLSHHEMTLFIAIFCALNSFLLLPNQSFWQSYWCLSFCCQSLICPIYFPISTVSFSFSWFCSLAVSYHSEQRSGKSRRPETTILHGFLSFVSISQGLISFVALCQHLEKSLFHMFGLFLPPYSG